MKPNNWYIKIFLKNAELTGEWFIDESGYANYADGDVGDQNHETLALESMIPEEYIQDYYEHTLSAKAKKEIGIDFINYMEKGGEARTWMVKKENWIRVHKNHFEVNSISADVLNRIANFIGEQLDYDDHHAELEDIFIQELSTNKFIEYTVKQLFNAVDSGDPISFLQQRANLDKTNRQKNKQQKHQTEVANANAYQKQVELSGQLRNLIGNNKYRLFINQTTHLNNYQKIGFLQSMISDQIYINGLNDDQFAQYLINKITF